MLFNSHLFIFLFLPIALLGFHLFARRVGARASRVWLIVASLCFYGWWNPVYLPLIGGSLLGNYVIGVRLARRADRGERRRALLALGVSANLALLGWFKYANFFVDNLNLMVGGQFGLHPIVLPLAISFFTFQQIAYLVDAHRQGGARDLLDYALFVTFFPQLIAGPIVHHREMLPQFAEAGASGVRRANIEAGLTIFAIGLFKKVVLADRIAVHATPVFEAAALGQTPDGAAAGAAALAYTFQLYFDFSGYSDMAVGLGRMFGIRLPINFDSPYQAESLIDFWRRWHITLSRFLRDYLYIPLGGNQKGVPRRYANLFITMLLGGLWHGAGWTFLIWGALHGVYLLLNHALRALRPPPQAVNGRPARGFVAQTAARLGVLLAVLVAWVFFRSADLATALRMLDGMAGARGFDGAALGAAVWLQLGGLLALVWWAPNTLALMQRDKPALLADRVLQPAPAWLCWRPSRVWALVLAAISVWSVLGINQYSEFLYFQF
jgi:alginate O-acetyltransferase complex protein AlgI